MYPSYQERTAYERSNAADASTAGRNAAPRPMPRHSKQCTSAPMQIPPVSAAKQTAQVVISSSTTAPSSSAVRSLLAHRVVFAISPISAPCRRGHSCQRRLICGLCFHGEIGLTVHDYLLCQRIRGANWNTPTCRIGSVVGPVIAPVSVAVWSCSPLPGVIHEQFPSDYRRKAQDLPQAA